jgi:CO/xanthine dehydrogenase Mo-binding subunit
MTAAVLTPEQSVLEGRKVLAELGAEPGIEYWGQAVGIIVADTKEHAEYAAKHGVKVTYTGAKKPVVNIDQAIEAGGAYISTTHKDWKSGNLVPMRTQRGDVPAAQKAAAHTSKGVVYSSGQYHCPRRPGAVKRH